MVDTKAEPVEPGREGRSDADQRPVSEPRPTSTKMSKSMHDGVEVWCDCCSCEAEPYWIEAMAKEPDSARNG